MKLDELLGAIPGCRVKGRTDIEISGITLDSRTVREGFLFAALAGGRSDGNDYTDEARQRGAVAVLLERPAANGSRATYLVVDDGRMAVARLADRFYGSPSRDLTVTGVTGTNGKTTVTYLMRDMLRRAGRRPALIGTIEYLIGERSIPATRTTPEAPQLQALLRDAVREGCDSVVMEVSSHALDQKRVACVEFSTAVFTNLGRDHLDFHGNSERYFGAKAGLFTVPSLGHAVINGDDPFGRRLVTMAAAPVCTYGLAEGATVRAAGIETGRGGSRFRLETARGSSEVLLPLLGRHNVYNALAAAAAAYCEGLPEEAVRGALNEAKPVPGRLEELPCGRPYRVFIDYAHTEDALENALMAIRGLCPGRILLVFGCGGDRDATKRLPMGRVAARLADIAIVTSDNPRGEPPGEIIAEIARGFVAEGRGCIRIENRRDAIAAALAEAREGDLILVAGKGHERTQEFKDTVIPFSDRDVIMELSAAARA